MSNEPVDLSVLIVCYRSKDLIGDCLHGVYAHTTGCRFEVLLVDCSQDGAVELVRRDFPQTRVFDNSQNLGFGAGNNFLAERATGKYLVLLNPDTVVSDDSLGELFRTAEARPDAGAVGGRTRLRDGSRDPGCRQCLPSLSRLCISAIGGARFLQGGLPENAATVDDVETLSGAFMLVRADAWRELGGFDTSFFMYSEELELCQRLRRHGWRILMTPHAEVLHLVGGGDAKNPDRIRLLTTAQMHFLRKFWRRPWALLGGGLIWLHGLLRLLGGSFGRRIIGADRALKLRRAYAGIVLRPQSWWYGYQTGRPND